MMWQNMFALVTAVFFVILVWVLFMANTNQDIFIFHITDNLPHGDKIAHILVFGALTLLLNITTRNKPLTFAKLHLQWGSFLVLIFATAEESSQYFIPSRTLDPLDYIASLFGIALFSVISRRIKIIPT